MSKLTVKARSMQIGTRSSPAGFDVVDEHGEPYAWSWSEDTARLISAAPGLLAFVERIATATACFEAFGYSHAPRECIGCDARTLLAEIRGA